MKNFYLKKIITVLSCAALAAVFIVALFFGAHEIPPTAETSGDIVYPLSVAQPDGTTKTEFITAEIGKDFSAVRISELGKLTKITKANYVANEFVYPNTLTRNMQTVDLEKPFEFAEKGTLIFVVLNLDPKAEDFDERAKKLAPYKTGDYWRFTLSLPKIFCAANVYLKSNLVARHGEIENYDFIDFNTSYDKRTEKFVSQTDVTDLDLRFYTKREAMANAFIAAQVVTVHYQSSGGAFSGMTESPLIGTEDDVKGIVESSETLSISFAILAVVVLAVLIVLSAIERKRDFVPSIVWVVGVALLLFSRFFLSQSTGAPLFWVAAGLASSFAILGGALLFMGVNVKKVPVKYVCLALAAAGALFAFICPFVPFGAAAALGIVCNVVKGVCAVALMGFIGLSILRKDDRHGILQTICAGVIAVGAISSVFMPQRFPAQIDPIFWLCVAVTATTFVSVFLVFTEMKKSNVYLTDNLHKEVERQIKDIKAVIEERDKLLQFVSHDMKKPLVNSSAVIDTLIEREKDDEQTKALRIVKQNNARVVENLSELATYAKFNYIAEPSQTVSLAALCAELYDFHRPDCEANGITLVNTVDARVKAFVKQKGLETVVSNIIINAVEHAECGTITLSVKTDKNYAVLCVADDGKGISSDIDIFAPYVSEKAVDTGGLGLYICKNIIDSMNGKLSFETGQSGTTFYISLLKA